MRSISAYLPAKKVTEPVISSMITVLWSCGGAGEMTDLVLFPKKKVWIATIEQMGMCLMSLGNRESVWFDVVKLFGTILERTP